MYLGRMTVVSDDCEYIGKDILNVKKNNANNFFQDHSPKLKSHDITSSSLNFTPHKIVPLHSIFLSIYSYIYGIYYLTSIICFDCVNAPAVIL